MTSSLSRNKVYTEVVASIAFTAISRADAEYLVNNFLSRRGIELIGSSSIRFYRGAYNATFSVMYRVHGGWKSDFVKKITSDADDAGIEISGLDVIVSRREIPDQCPRTECIPCSFVAQGLAKKEFRSYKRDGHMFVENRPDEGEPDEYEQAVEDEPRKSVFSIFKRR